MRFVKMHGIGNDYIYLDAFMDPSLESRADLPALARAMSDRHRGVGSDGLILVCRPTDPDVAHARMRMFNSDGSESEMCGNGLRCVAKFAHDRLGIKARPMRIQTGRGVLEIDYKVEGGRLAEATVDMGEPILELDRVPVTTKGLSRAARDAEYTLDIAGKALHASFVSMGNPHAVIFDDGERPLDTDALAAIDLSRIGPLIETHSAFPRRVNAHFVARTRPGEATMRTWERGAGATMACGTGACAVAVAGARTGRLDRDVLLHLPGGDLRIRWDEKTGHVHMTGPATHVFDGDWPA